MGRSAEARAFEDRTAVPREEWTGEDDGAREASEAAWRAELGRRGEDAAARFLERRGYDIVERNWECAAGEADIVARDGDGSIVFVEVKTRSNCERGLPSEAVDAEKRKRYERIAACFLADYDVVDVPVRFDIIGIVAVAEDRAMIRHHINAFCAA